MSLGGAEQTALLLCYARMRKYNTLVPTAAQLICELANTRMTFTRKEWDGKRKAAHKELRNTNVRRNRTAFWQSVCVSFSIRKKVQTAA